jgi:hypothetical protein
MYLDTWLDQAEVVINTKALDDRAVCAGSSVEPVMQFSRIEPVSKLLGLFEVSDGDTCVVNKLVLETCFV